MPRRVSSPAPRAGRAPAEWRWRAAAPCTRQAPKSRKTAPPESVRNECRCAFATPFPFPGCYRSARVGDRVDAVRFPGRPTAFLVHLRMHAERTGVEEALHEAGDEVAANDLARRTAERALRKHDVRIRRLDGAEFFERRNQGAAQRRRHAQRIAERPFLAVVERADLLARVEQRLGTALQPESAAVRPHQRDDVGELGCHFLDERRSGLRRGLPCRLAGSALPVKGNADYGELRIERLDLGRQLLLVDLRETESNLQEPGARGQVGDLLALYGIALPGQEHHQPCERACLVGATDRNDCFHLFVPCCPVSSRIVPGIWHRVLAIRPTCPKNHPWVQFPTSQSAESRTGKVP